MTATLVEKLQKNGWHYLGQFDNLPRGLEPVCLGFQTKNLEKTFFAKERREWLLVQDLTNPNGLALFRYSGFHSPVPATNRVKSKREEELNQKGWYYLYNQSRQASPANTSLRAPRSLRDIRQQYLEEGWPEVLVDKQAFMADGKPLDCDMVAVYVRVPGAKAVA
ncbi:MAG: hypothetical protein HY438_03590 [DPANN group archaeon]|nr:hypothetical protein [DPANN group archaeon]